MCPIQDAVPSRPGWEKHESTTKHHPDDLSRWKSHVPHPGRSFIAPRVGKYDKAPPSMICHADARYLRLHAAFDHPRPILLSLAEGDKHGYAMMKDARSPQGGGVRLGPGTLYGSLDRMMRDGLVEETGISDDERRRYYRLTGFGRKALASELELRARQA